MPTPPTTFILCLLGLYILLLVIVWPSAVFQASLTTPLSKHGVCAKCCHLPFALLIRPYCVSSVRSTEKIHLRNSYGRGSFLQQIHQFFLSFLLLNFNSTDIINKKINLRCSVHRLSSLVKVQLIDLTAI